MEKTTKTHKSSKFNSTDFTDCCGLAVTKTETQCPKCKARVTERKTK